LQTTKGASATGAGAIQPGGSLTMSASPIGKHAAPAPLRPDLRRCGDPDKDRQPSLEPVRMAGNTSTAVLR